MTSRDIRKSFLEFFQSRSHNILESAPMVIKNDPTLMFTNAGMNQFKDIFLGNRKADNPRVANSQKCLRVSGKHNDLEEVGHDTYHHTMFEMLGNWSFGDYFKEKAIDLAWEFLTKKMNIHSSRLYVTVFQGDTQDGTEKDIDAYRYWKKHVPEGRILEGSRKDNFWEMGETGPCGPCSEIHVDIRDDKERSELDGASLINKGDPRVIEIWNLVFIQYNRLADGSLTPLPEKHVDTGMGFERLCMVVQGKQSNYDTDIFQDIIKQISALTGIEYNRSKESAVAMRVIADHLRAISFSIAEGQLPSNNKAGYVIRRILRRAIRYSYTFLNQQEPVIYRLVNELVNLMGESYPELKDQQELIKKVIREEEISFLRTLDKGIHLLEGYIRNAKTEKSKYIPGKIAFELYDTYGFPLDLTELILREEGLAVSLGEYEQEMARQKSRSKEDASKDTSDWTVLKDGMETKFTGYDQLEDEIHILRYRKIRTKDKELYQLVFDNTPFYAESGGQVGDAGYIDDGDRKWSIQDTQKENELIVHISNQLPVNPGATFKAMVNRSKRMDTINNHSATHLLHHALRQVLGNHVEQKGSLVHPDYLRFDFSHFQKVSDDELQKLESIVNEKIRQNLDREEWRELPMEEAKKMGAMALFGEKYGKEVRVIKFGDSVELCGGTHVRSTGSIGYFKILKESAVAAGIRRIEAITGEKAQQYIIEQEEILKRIREIFPASRDLAESVTKLNQDHQELLKEFEALRNEKKGSLVKDLENRIHEVRGTHLVAEKVNVTSAGDLRDISFQMRKQTDKLVMILGAEIEGKAHLSIILSDELVKDKNLDASSLIRDIAKHIQGGGGGQSFFATAGGKDPGGIGNALEYAQKLISEKL